MDYAMTVQILTPRDYQEEAITSTQEYFDSHGVGDRPAVVLPTGGGKTVVFAHLAKRHFEAYGSRVVVLVHTDELVSQAYDKLRAIAPALRVGRVKASRNDVRADLIVGSVQTLRNKRRREAISNVGLVIVDECHHASAKSYRDILDHFEWFADDAGARVLGVTATLMRGDRKGLGHIWHQVVTRRSISWMVRKGHLRDPRGKRIEVADLDLAKVKRSGGDFANGSLGEALTRSFAPSIVASAYLEHAGDRSGLVFAPTVASAYEFADAFAEAGIKVETVHGGLAPTERSEILARLSAGTTQVVCNCMVLTEGFDSPRVSCVAIARPTRSPVLYQQMVGRALRIDPRNPGLTDALILDVTGASATHTLASLVDLSDGSIKPKDGQSLIEAEDELAEAIESGGGVPDYVTVHTGPTTVVDFDPLARASKRVWSVTAGGTWFLSAGEAYVFLTPSVQPGAAADVYDIVWTRKDRNRAKPQITYDGVTGDWGFTSHIELPLDLAFAWGEEVAVDLAGDTGMFGADTLMAKKARWRKQDPTDAQVYACRTRGITIPPDATRGSVSVLLDTYSASSMIDPAAAYFEGLRHEDRKRTAVNV
jgi:superfamily II DNA or RNA helicase